MFQHSALPHGFEILMNSELRNVDESIHILRGYLDSRHQQKHFFALSLLAREALNNAMIHGNGSDTDKQVIMRLITRDGRYFLEVEDEGRGFEWIQFMNSSSDESDETGRGHEIYRNYARSVRYNVEGNILCLEYEA